ncbi:hypothetical protein K1T35_47980 (plasmid) [Pseudonocardia sp. DSM 110487]|uniref:hypothetical protein n=1 Tax=Pseudonocardia sp. DSM 110487 TaxID=2865833 RepID=UPI001C6A797F|nr:hypothetical protein [Pseudonocardia sp. DSM 110487]QYN41091.1 hypothetical protein K1T35_47980 [Pseudonocardia sp. DSM 110487]
MSWLALDWAETAPVADVYERVILTLMAGRADKDGTGVWLSPGTIARGAVSDEQTVKRRMRALRERGVIAYGDQSLAAKIPANRRPKVYDLMIPVSFYSPTQLAEVNRMREENGRPPLTPENRPDLPEAAPSRKARSDTGTSRPRSAAADEADKQPLTWTDSQGGLVDPPAMEAGGSTRPGQGGLVDPARGVYETPKTPRDNPSEEPTGGRRNGVRHPREGTPDPAPEIVFNLDDKDTWLCRRHRANPPRPDEDRKSCPGCGRTRRWSEKQLAERAAAAAARRKTCTWHDDARHVIDPATGGPFHPAVKCDCTTTSPEAVAARIAATQEANRPSGPIATAGRAEYRRRFPRKPTARPATGRRRAATDSTGNSDRHATPPAVDHEGLPMTQGSHNAAGVKASRLDRVEESA